MERVESACVWDYSQTAIASPLRSETEPFGMAVRFAECASFKKTAHWLVTPRAIE